MLFDLPLKELRVYLPEREEPADFDDFWARTLADIRKHRLDARFEPIEAGLTTVDVADVTFAGFACLELPFRELLEFLAEACDADVRCAARGPLGTDAEYTFGLDIAREQDERECARAHETD